MGHQFSKARIMPPKRYKYVHGDPDFYKYVCETKTETEMEKSWKGRMTYIGWPPGLSRVEFRNIGDGGSEGFLPTRLIPRRTSV